MNRLLIVAFAIVFSSCNEKSNTASYHSEIGAVIYDAQVANLNKEIGHYSQLSEIGNFIYGCDSVLEQRCSQMEATLEKNDKISLEEQKEFVDYFKRIVSGSPYVDSTRFNSLTDMAIRSKSDISLLKLYIKSCFVSVLNDNKLLPFDSYGPNFCADSWKINMGDTFNCRIGINAFSNKLPIQWFIVKKLEQGLSKDNILDTLHLNEKGYANFKTAKYQKGENFINIISKLKMPSGDRTFSNSIRFSVQ